MNLDLNALLPVLAQLGPWGLAAAAAIMWLRARNGGKLIPTPAPNPAPVDPTVPSPLQPAPLQPAPNSGGTPLLDALLFALRKRLAPAQQKFEHRPDGDDIDPATAAELIQKLLK